MSDDYRRYKRQTQERMRQRAEHTFQGRYNEGVIQTVVKHPGNADHGAMYEVDWVEEDGGSSGTLMPDLGFEPAVGDTIRIYGLMGQRIRGIDLRGKFLFFLTDKDLAAENARWLEHHEAEQHAEFEKHRASLDRQYEDLPPVFRRRMDRFRTNNPDFRWKYEGYEMFCCTEAVKLVDRLKTLAALEEYAAADQDHQKEMVPDVHEGHSGNTFGMAITLAHHYLQDESLVWREHGAMSPLTGCEEYGCLPVDEEGNPIIDPPPPEPESGVMLVGAPIRA